MVVLTEFSCEVVPDDSEILERNFHFIKKATDVVLKMMMMLGATQWLIKKAFVGDSGIRNNHYKFCYSYQHVYFGCYTHNVSVVVFSGHLQVSAFVIFSEFRTESFILRL